MMMMVVDGIIAVMNSLFSFFFLSFILFLVLYFAFILCISAPPSYHQLYCFLTQFSLSTFFLDGKGGISFFFSFSSSDCEKKGKCASCVCVVVVAVKEVDGYSCVYLVYVIPERKVSISIRVAEKERESFMKNQKLTIGK